MIADIRGYTSFTQARGDEDAGRLAGRFAACTRECVDAGGGTLLELRGDEALCVFDSPRRALRTAIALQRAYADATREDPSLPLPVGIGLDAGEAVAVEEGYRGGALNLAARRPANRLSTGPACSSRPPANARSSAIPSKPRRYAKGC